MSNNPSDGPRRGASGRFLREPRPGEQLAFDTDLVGTGAGGFDRPVEEVSEISEFDSTRCAASRYHFEDSKMFMSWTNGKTPWIYHDVPFPIYTSFVSAPSQGKFVNSTLNLFAHNKLFPGMQYANYVYGVMPKA